MENEDEIELIQDKQTYLRVQAEVDRLIADLRLEALHPHDPRNLALRLRLRQLRASLLIYNEQATIMAND